MSDIINLRHYLCTHALHILILLCRIWKFLSELPVGTLTRLFVWSLLMAMSCFLRESQGSWFQLKKKLCLLFVCSSMILIQYNAACLTGVIHRRLYIYSMEYWIHQWGEYLILFTFKRSFYWTNGFVVE